MATYRRIKFDRVKQWAKKGALVAVPTISILFLFLVSLDAIDITGYSGDQICAGTPDDPCYAYINFTAKTDVYIYPNESWYFYTDIPVKSIKIQRSWGKSWRTIDLTKSWSTKVKYAIKFSKGTDYQIRFVAEKHSPYDEIKWGFSDIDPIWLPIEKEKELATITYSKNTQVTDSPNGARKIVDGFRTVELWDGSYIAESDLDFDSGNWRYKAEDKGTYYTVTRKGESFNIPKMEGIVFGEKRIIVPETFKSLSSVSGKMKGLTNDKYLKYETGLANAKVVDNIIYIGSEFWSERVVVKDSGTLVTVEGNDVLNYSYVYPDVSVVNGEVRIHLDVKDLEKMVYPLSLHAPTWVTNSSVGFGGVFTNTVECGDGGVRLDHNQTGLVSWWNFDEDTGSTTYDYTGNNNDGTIHGATWTTSDEFKGALNFDGVNDYVAVDSNLGIGNGDITIFAWFNATFATTALNHAALVSCWDNDAKIDYRIFQDQTGIGVARYAPHIHWGSTSETAINAGQWYHVGLMYSGTTLSFYLNGAFQDSIIANFTGTGDIITSTKIGKGASPTAQTYFNGIIDDVHIYNRSLSPTEINATMRGETRHTTGNYTSQTHDIGSDNVVKVISVTFTNASIGTALNIYTKTSYDNISWTEWELVRADAVNDTEYAVSIGGRYIQYRVEENTTNATKVDAFYTVTLNSESSAGYTYTLTEGELTKHYDDSVVLIDDSVPVWVNFTNKKEFHIESNLTENINLTAFLNVTKCTIEKVTYYTNGTWKYYKEGDDGYNCTNAIMTIYLDLVSQGRNYVHPLYEGLGR